VKRVAAACAGACLALACRRAPPIEATPLPVAITDVEPSPEVRVTPPSDAPAAPPPSPASRAGDLERALVGARVLRLDAASDRDRRDGRFDAEVEGDAIPKGGRAIVEIATAKAPVAWKGRLAFHRLAAAIGADLVPACVARDLPVGRLGAWLANDGASLAFAKTDARVRNDGTVAALVFTPDSAAGGEPWTAPRVRPVDARSYEAGRWAVAAASEAPTREDAAARDYVMWIALDYLAAVTVRPHLFVTQAAPSRLVLFDNEYAFPVRPSIESMSSNLHRLRAVRRFPRALRDGLAALDPARERELFTGGAFDGWLLAPRGVVELDQRRLAVLSLVEAEIAARGEAAVLVP
jgi:hypothetical protein